MSMRNAPKNIKKQPWPNGWGKSAIKPKSVQAPDVDATSVSSSQESDAPKMRGLLGSHNRRASTGSTRHIAVDMEADTSGSSIRRSSAPEILGLSEDELMADDSNFSAGQVIFNAINDDRMADVSLVGRDGVEIRAIKYVLGCQCDTLKEKLYEDASKAKVFIGNYSENILQALKLYCYTCEIEESSILKQRGDLSVRELVELAGLAKQYKFDALFSMASTILRRILGSAPWLACAAYDTAGDVDVGELETLVGNFIRKRCPEVLTETCAMEYFSPERLYDFLDTAYFKDIETLLYIMKWVEKQGQTSQNMDVAKSMVSRKNIRLEKLLLDPALVIVVRKSGLFDLQQIDCILNGTYVTNTNDKNDDTDEEGNPSSSTTSHGGEINDEQVHDSPTTCYQLTLCGEVVALQV